METKTPRIPPNLAYPVVFGPSFPDFTMTTRGGRQVFSSRTNQNLFLNHWDFTDSGTFTMATLLKKTSKWQECWPLVWDHVWVGEAGEFVDWAYFLSEPRWDDSDAFQRLLGFCQWEPEKRFFREWSRAQYARGVGEAYESWARGKAVDWSQTNETFTFLDLIFNFPALIPETWLNYLGSEKTVEDERHLSENPSRVDFAVFAGGRKYIVEIDGPSHYADYDATNTPPYTVNEEKYAKNLAIERSLRRQGWDIYRFANVEIARSSGDDFVRLITSAELPGLYWMDEIFTVVNERPVATEWHVNRALEGLVA